jgi:sulfite exporter TauE/SafE/copper chaperone CopZ
MSRQDLGPLPDAGPLDDVRPPRPSSTGIKTMAAPSARTDGCASERSGSTGVSITGMTCRACEVRVGKALKKLPGVSDVKVSATLGTAIIYADVPPTRAQIVQAVERAGYQAAAPAWVSRDRNVWTTAIPVAILVAATAYVAIQSGLLGLAPSAGSHAGVIVALLVGLAAGVSTCMALIGGLLLAISAAHAAANPVAVSTWHGRLRPQLMFHAGRLLSFAIGGGLLGALGSTIPMPPSVLATGVLIAALVMIILGVRLTGVSPKIAGWSPSLPGALGRWVNRDGAGGYTDGRTAAAGAGTFLMPCGFTQAMQILAVSTGSPLRASAIMVLFALGTLPGLLGLGLAAGVAGSRGGTTALRVVGVVVIAFALINVTGAVRSLGVNLSFSSHVTATAISSNVSVTGNSQTVTMTQTTRGYEPADTVVYAGLPIKWVVNATDSYSCSSALRIPSVGVSVNMQPGINSIAVPALSSGTTTFTCVMGMYTGHLIAIPRTTPSAAPTA